MSIWLRTSFLHVRLVRSTTFSTCGPGRARAHAKGKSKRAAPVVGNRSAAGQTLLCCALGSGHRAGGGGASGYAQLCSCPAHGSFAKGATEAQEECQVR